jgi:hypothetical protein
VPSGHTWIPRVSAIIFRTVVSPTPLPELEQTYSLLKIYYGAEDTARKGMTKLQIESYFAEDLQRKWIKNIITVWKQGLNWDEFVAIGIKEMKKKAQNTDFNKSVQ